MHVITFKTTFIAQSRSGAEFMKSRVQHAVKNQLNTAQILADNRLVMNLANTPFLNITLNME